MCQVRRILMIMVLSLATGGLLVGLSYAQSEGEQTDSSSNGDASAANEPASTAVPDDRTDKTASEGQTEADDEQPSSEQVMEQLLEQRKDRAVEPADSPGEDAAKQGEDQANMPAAGVKADESVLGIAPSQGKQQPNLRREGEFVVNRRGKLARAKESNRLMFVFESDKQASPEPPMILQACRTLETMEKIVQKRGESVTFVISGQVHTYRNKNYLMPTMMKIAENRGNLE